MARRRRRRGQRSLLTVCTLLSVVALGGWWLYPSGEDRPELSTAVTLGPKARLTTDRPEVPPEREPRPGIPEKGSNGPSSVLAARAASASSQAESLIAAGKQAITQDDVIAARAHFSEAMQHAVGENQATFLQAELTRIGNESIFSHRLIDGDPLVERYVIQPGDTLAKIASKHRVSADLLAAINGIRNKNRIRAGQSVKVIHGPFRAVIDKKAYALDVYLGNTFVKHYKVGLGVDDSTPSGEWLVNTKLKNPTYYPPRGGDIIAADDPENPLGERWIGLQGIGAGAIGQLRYGIHGTIEPDSIGRDASMGCVRMYNEDVEAFYTYLVEKHSTVTIR